MKLESYPQFHLPLSVIWPIRLFSGDRFLRTCSSVKIFLSLKIVQCSSQLRALGSDGQAYFFLASQFSYQHRLFATRMSIFSFIRTLIMSKLTYSSLRYAKVLGQLSHASLRASFFPLLTSSSTFVDKEIGGRPERLRSLNLPVISNLLIVR